MALLVDLSRGALSSTSLQYHVPCATASSRNRIPSHVTVRAWNASPALQSELSTSSLSAGFRVQAVEETSSSSSVASPTEDKSAFGVPQGGCAACGKPEKVGGCNGEGRIQGGIGAVPGFGWWPIKAFRPCPAFVESGGKYRRIGQSLDEVAFGRAAASDDLDISERLKGQ
ncbi:hypothetical protein MPTK1_3g17830 [Marchantia polymorpha subsp. ruderalis]|uniref:Uncharacterized protein n=2 Tax=Marchantia polymorpha TaxID=3197 RepID=A0AAF6B1Z6_MARPO|nr:hypothetical protein MARPO_0039s0013 [Marchantia polymorpha]BBN06030.1 hypothetical protein Mp_3g17830 [Marchantia polymorpha subsp. ruderalis]|eukprot:PTQ40498.1 hypothetical protein MARPO_0039s0013 [Marchantia polymorpha]